MIAFRAARRRLQLATLMLAGCVAGCAGIPEEAYRLPPSSPGVREAQTRTFEVPDEASILQVAVALMQDMEYNFDTIEYELGILSGSKVVDADSMAQQTGLIIADGWGAEILRRPESHVVHASRRKAVTLAFARAAALRLHGLYDPDVGF